MINEYARLEPLKQTHAEELKQFELANRTYFERSVAGRGDGYYEPEGFLDALSRLLQDHASGLVHPFVIRNRSGELVGRINLSMEGATAEVGYRIAQSAGGQGIATAALRAVVVRAPNLQLDRLAACTTPSNLASQRVLEKAGFVHERTQPDAVTLHGELVDFLHYGRTVAATMIHG